MKILDPTALEDKVGFVNILRHYATIPAYLVVATWLGREDSNLRMSVPKTDALPLGDAPTACDPARDHNTAGSGFPAFRADGPSETGQLRE